MYGCIHFKHECGKYLNIVYWKKKDDELGLGKVKGKNSDSSYEHVKSSWSGNELLVHSVNPCNWGMTQWTSKTAEDRELFLQLICENKQITQARKVLVKYIVNIKVVKYLKPFAHVTIKSQL